MTLSNVLDGMMELLILPCWLLYKGFLYRFVTVLDVF